ncbi:hypothetical protein [Bacteroides fluxus]|uniref:Uncharacterized protein n=1 Tax=Bacteroides fluxus YIT 12057 TaxID=763034 RepID=F3PPA3_9BACE|nr:hypothetical protein [Bacteroides fluxus]EGF59309.1 hypothetical protein HMPREF9446_00544 [Bacteroides fluxus YIT 12057]
MMGRGYSGNTFAGLSWEAQLVLILLPTGFHCAKLSITNNVNKNDKIITFLIALINFTDFNECKYKLVRKDKIEE